MRQIRCGVIGLGWFGEKHCEILHDLPLANLHSVCTRRPGRVQEVADRFGIAKTHTDYHELLADPEVDVERGLAPRDPYGLLAPQDLPQLVGRPARWQARW